MKKIAILGIAIITFCTNPIRSFAWGRTGHHLVAQIAFHYLDDKTKQSVKHYLGRTSFEDAATWMDDQRSNHYYDFMKPWHYIDIPKEESYKNLVEKNIITVLNAAVTGLQHNRQDLKDSKVKDYLLYIFHLTGDLAMPLHTGYPDDKGGNSVEITSPIYNGNLHSFWDTQIIEDQKITEADCEKLYEQFTQDEITAIQKIDILQWMNQSRNLLDTVYNFQNDKIDQAYIDRNTVVIKKQLLIAGLHLAAVLKDVFKNDVATNETAVKEDEMILTPPKEVEIVVDTPRNADAAIKTIPVEDAAKYEGQVVKICTKIYGTKYLESASGKPTFLNAGASYPNSPLTIVIWNNDRKNFKNKPEEYYDKKDICVTGKIKIFKGKPEIVISKEDDIEIK